MRVLLSEGGGSRNPDAAKQHDRIWCDPRLRMGSREGMGRSMPAGQMDDISSIIEMAELISMHMSCALSAFYEPLCGRNDGEFLRKKLSNTTRG